MIKDDRIGHSHRFGEKMNSAFRGISSLGNGDLPVKEDLRYTPCAPLTLNPPSQDAATQPGVACCKRDSQARCAPSPAQARCCEPTSRPCRCAAPRRHALPGPETVNDFRAVDTHSKGGNAKGNITRGYPKLPSPSGGCPGGAFCVRRRHNHPYRNMIMGLARLWTTSPGLTFLGSIPFPVLDRAK